MTIKYTNTYQLAYVDGDSALPDLAAASQKMAQSADAALTRGGLVPPGASDLAGLSGRVTALEQVRPGKKLYKPTATPTQLVSAGWALITWESRDTLAAGTGLFAPANPGRLVATKAGRYRSSVTLPSNIATSSSRQIQIRSQPAGTTPSSASTGTMLGATILQAQTALAVQQCIADEFVLAVGDFVECYAYSTVASTPFGTQSGYDALFTLTYLGATQ